MNTETETNALQTRAYLSGPMRGVVHYNSRAFDAAERVLTEAGFVVISPAAKDRESGFDAYTLPNDWDWTQFPSSLSLHRVIRGDIEDILSCDRVYVLPGWRDSVGATAEVAVADWAGKPVYELAVTRTENGEGFQSQRTQRGGTPQSADVHEFSTGAVRSSDADGEAWHLISPIGLRRVAQTCREGEKKYSAYNWEKGMPVTELLNHGLRHLYLYLAGDRSEDHLAHAAWNCLGAMHSEELWEDLNAGTLRQEGCVAP